MLDAVCGRIRNPRMPAQDFVDFGGIDVDASRNDHIVQPVLNEEVTFAIYPANVAGVKPSVADYLACGLGPVPVPKHDVVSADQNLAFFAGLGVLAGQR